MSSTAIFYSGCEGDMHYKIATTYADRVLMSYFYLRSKAGLLQKRKNAKPQIEFMIDSGAHTLQKEEEDLKLAFWEDYLKQYTQWLRENREYIYCAVELDVANQVGLPITREWRKRYFEPLEDEGMQIVFVWHPDDGLEEFEAMCRKYRYVGLTHQTFAEKTAPRLMMVCRRFRCKVHGFAITSPKAIRDYSGGS